MGIGVGGRHHGLQAAVFVLAALGALCWPAAVRAAETTGSISARIVTPDGRPVAGVRITAVSPSGRYDGVSDAAGRLTLAAVSPDVYAVEASAAGSEPSRITGVTVAPGQRVALTITRGGALARIGRVAAANAAFAAGATRDTYVVSGDRRSGPRRPTRRGSRRICAVRCKVRSRRFPACSRTSSRTRSCAAGKSTTSCSATTPFRCRRRSSPNPAATSSARSSRQPVRATPR